MYGEKRAAQILSLKMDLQNRLLRHLNDTLPRDLKLSLTSTQIREILSSISNYVYDSTKAEVDISLIQKKGWHKDQPGQSRIERSIAEDFQKELEKL